MARLLLTGWHVDAQHPDVRIFKNHRDIRVLAFDGVGGGQVNGWRRPAIHILQFDEEIVPVAVTAGNPASVCMVG